MKRESIYAASLRYEERINMSRFGKVLTAMVTPFTSSGDLDLDEAGRLAQWLIQDGNE